MNKSTERFILYCLIRFFIVLLYLSIYSNFEMVFQGWAWIAMLFVIFFVTSGWLVLWASNIIETKPKKAKGLMAISFGVDLMISFFLFSGNIGYAVTGLIALIVVFYKHLLILFKKKE